MKIDGALHTVFVYISTLLKRVCLVLAVVGDFSFSSVSSPLWSPTLSLSVFPPFSLYVLFKTSLLLDGFYILQQSEKESDAPQTPEENERARHTEEGESESTESEP